MDTPDLPENEPEEITWQDDENRATLFLRSVFVLLSGALILGVQAQPSFTQPWLQIAGMNVVLPVCVIWFFFGQGLRPVEWLSDQKYNAWNYGVNFKEWRLHLKWAVAICIPVIVIALLIKLNILFPPPKGSAILEIDWPSYISAAIMAWLFGCFFVVFFLGYLLFGMAQGFSIVGAILGLLFIPVLALPKHLEILQDPTFIFYVVIILALTGISWKTKSIASAFYFVLMVVPLVMLILK
jgi:hypothetical protein